MGRKTSTIRQLFCSFLFLGFVVTLLGGSCWWLLRNGLSVEHIALAGIDLRGLSLRLDRGLILHIREMDVADRGGVSSPDRWDRRLSYLKKWGGYIQEVDIKALSFRGETAAISYQEGQFHASTGQFSVDALLSYSGSRLWINLVNLDISSWKLSAGGLASYSLMEDRLLFTGRFTHPLGSGRLWLSQQDGRVEAALSSNEFTQLAELMRLFPVDSEAVGWVEENIAAARYRIKDLRFRVNMRDLASFGPDDISGTAEADSVDVRFHPELAPVHCDRVHISLAGDRMTFALDNPRYNTKNLQGSSVYIDNLIGAGSALGIDLKAETAKDKVVDEILDKYDINFPARQVRGTSALNLRLLFDLSDFTLAVGGNVHSGPGTWMWRENLLKTTGASVRILNNLVEVQDADLSIAKQFHASVSGMFDAAVLHGELVCAFRTLNLSVAGTPVVRADGLLTPLAVDFARDELLISAPELRTSVRYGKKQTDVDISDLKAVESFVPPFQRFHFSGGSLRLSTSDFENVRFAGEMEIPNSLLTLGGQPISRFQFQGGRTPERADIAVNGNNIAVSWTDELVVNLAGYLFNIDTKSYADGKQASSPFPLRVRGSQALLKIKGQNIDTGRFELEMKDKDVSFGAELAKGNILYESKQGVKGFAGRGLDATLVDGFLKNADLTDGTMNVYLKGDPGNFEGYLEMNNILIKDTKLLNNILAFLNAVPALATFSSPGFDLDGYRVKEGVMYVRYRNDILTIEELRTDGVTINTEAKGWINNADRTLQLTMELIALKDYSRILEKIPLAGYVILGENGSLSTSLDIQGSLDHPEIKTNLAREILMSPINLIKRTVEWPFRLFGRISGNGTVDPEPAGRPRESSPAH